MMILVLQKIFKRYLSHLESSLVDPSHYVFRALFKTRSGHTLVSINKPISYSSVRDYVKSTFKDIVSNICLLYTSPSPRDQRGSRMPSSA